MTGEVLQLRDFLTVDRIGEEIAIKWMEWNLARESKMAEWAEQRRYIYATDTRHTSAGKLPWSNSTTIPKLTQIRDNLYANYMASMFPKRKWLNWEGDTQSDEEKVKVNAIKDYMMWVVNQPDFKVTLSKCLLDYIDYGNPFGTVEWADMRVEDPKTGQKHGYVGPRLVRIAPQDLVFNPLAPSFQRTPKIWRTVMSLGEAKKTLQKLAPTPEDKEKAQKVYDYLIQYRQNALRYTGWELQFVDSFFNIDGFDTFRRYLESDYAELLIFAGDLYDREGDELKENRLIVVIDRHSVALDVPYPTTTAEIPIYTSGWRPRQDNLWAMGPLENLVGLQYRLDHLENMKSDILDLVTYPPIMIKGSGAIGDFKWGPMERIYVDADGDVELKSPDVNALQVNIEIQGIMQLMEEMAGSPKEAMGFRTPGEKTAYEVQRLENAAARIFQNKISQFEEQFLEPLLNAMLALARQYMDDTVIRVIDDEFGSVAFQTITAADISAQGKLRALAARHFAEQAELVQNLTNFYSSAIGADELVKSHMSSIATAKLIEDCLNIQDWDIVLPYVRISEQAEAQQLMQEGQEQTMVKQQTPSGITPDDWSAPNPAQDMQSQMNPGAQ